MSELNRRDLLRVLGATVATTALPAAAEAASKAPASIAPMLPSAVPAAKAASAAAPTFFTPHEYQTVQLLADLIIPRDEKSGSASDAGVPAFIDFWMTDRPDAQLPMRGGLAWLDRECRDRYEADFLTCTAAQRTALLDLIAWPAKAPAEVSQGVAFFNMFRDLTASGFWSSKVGVEDLGYSGNRPMGDWKGCPPEALRKLGVGGTQ